MNATVKCSPTKCLGGGKCKIKFEPPDFLLAKNYWSNSNSKRI
jgi:hypothetical protein